MVLPVSPMTNTWYPRARGAGPFFGVGNFGKRRSHARRLPLARWGELKGACLWRSLADHKRSAVSGTVAMHTGSCLWCCLHCSQT